MKTEEYRPDNWMELIGNNVCLEWVEANAKFYILDEKTFSSHAMIWKVPDTNQRGWVGVRMKIEYLQGEGYFMDFEPIFSDIEWAIETTKKDITTDFNRAVQLANLHTI